MNGREVRSLTLDRLGDLPDPCRGCLFWERDPVHARRAQEHGDPAQDKESWLSAALLEWGSVGRIAYVDGQPVGYVTYAPAHLVPRVTGFPTAPVSGDAVLLMTAAVSPQYAGQGLGRVLVQAAAKDLHRRDIRADGGLRPAGRPVRTPRGVRPAGGLPVGGRLQDGAGARRLAADAARPAHDAVLARGRGGGDRPVAPAGAGARAHPRPRRGPHRSRADGRDRG